jgi:hypothetical protein
MKLQSELDALLATARELVQAEDDAIHQISQLYDALTRSKATLKRTRTLAQATARRMRTVDAHGPAGLGRDAAEIVRGLHVRIVDRDRSRLRSAAS